LISFKDPGDRTPAFPRLSDSRLVRVQSLHNTTKAAETIKMAQAEVRAIIRTRDDGGQELLVVIPSKYTCEGSGISRVAIMMPENVKRNEIADMEVEEVGYCFCVWNKAPFLLHTKSYILPN
jgi:hypothetical protein